MIRQQQQENHSPGTIQENTRGTSQKRTSVFLGHILHEYEWKPEGAIRAVIHICHGLHEYMGRYEEIAEQLKNNGFLVRGIDLVGHGRSGGERGHINSFELYMTDVANHIKDTRKEFSDLPLFLMGQSLGGVVAIGVVLRMQEIFVGVILCATSMLTVPSIIRFGTRIIACIAPTAGLRRNDVNLISSVPEEVERYLNDPLIYQGKVKASWSSALFKSSNTYSRRLQEVSLPALIMYGTDDHPRLVAASMLVNSGVASADKTFEHFEGSRHEILHDKEQERVRDMICQWMVDRLPNNQAKEEVNTVVNPQPLEEPAQPHQVLYPKL